MKCCLEYTGGRGYCYQILLFRVPSAILHFHQMKKVQSIGENNFLLVVRVFSSLVYICGSFDFNHQIWERFLKARGGNAVFLVA